MSTAIRRRPVRRAVITAVAVAAGALGVVPAAPANAAQTGVVESGTLVWGLSTYLNTTAMGSIGPLASGYVAPASYDAGTKLSTFTVESASIASDGAAVINLDGASLNYAPTGNRWLKLDDLVISVDSAGNGSLSAAVSYGPGVGTYPTSSYDPTVAPFRGPTRVDVVDLVGNTASENSVTKNVSTFPSLDGTWSPALIAFLAGDPSAEPAVPGLSYRSQLVNDDPAKAPKPLNAAVDLAVASTTTSFGAATDAGVPLDIIGAGFKKTTPGVYVSLREYADGAAPYAGGAVWATSPTAWVSNNAADIGPDPATGAQASIGDDGSFTASLLLTPTVLAALDPAKKYSLVTRKAHGQGTVPSNADQVTETPVDVSGLKKASVVAATVAETVVGTPATVQVSVTGADASVPTGAVTVKSGATTVGTGTLAGGTATVPVSGLPVGATELTVQYAGTAAHWSSAKAVTATVAKVASSAAITAPATSTYGKAVKVSVAVPGATGPVTLTGAGAAQAGALADGVATFTLPAALTAGAHTLTASYAGDANRSGATATHRLTVAKAATSTTVKLSPKPTAKKNGRAVVTLKGATTGSRVVVVVKKAGKVVKRTTVKVNGSGRVAVALPKAAKGGAFTLTATYAGDKNHKASSKKATYKVTKPKKR